MRTLLAVILLLCCVPGLHASPLGEVRVAVADRSTEARQKALSEGLRQVLVRLTGDRASASDASLAPLLADASRWAQQFSYDASADELLLTIRFDVPVLMRQLEQRGSPVWTLSRPDTLFWLVIQRSVSGEILSRQSSDPAARVLADAAAARGLPLVMPAMDAEDLAAVQAADIRGHFDQVLMRGSDRYRAPFVVAAVLYPGAAPQLRWRMLHQQRVEESGQIDAADEQEAIRLLVDRVTGLIAPRYVVRPGEAIAQRLVVDGIGSLDDWRAVTQHVQSLAGVKDFQVASIDRSRLILDLTFSGHPEQLGALLSLDARLGPCSHTAASADAGAPSVQLCWRETVRP
ncbi:MAG: DUF2066 domain-containing protein [Alcanivoracaceae bacterium]